MLRGLPAVLRLPILPRLGSTLELARWLRSVSFGRTAALLAVPEGRADLCEDARLRAALWSARERAAAACADARMLPAAALQLAAAAASGPVLAVLRPLYDLDDADVLEAALRKPLHIARGAANAARTLRDAAAPPALALHAATARATGCHFAIDARPVNNPQVSAPACAMPPPPPRASCLHRSSAPSRPLSSLVQPRVSRPPGASQQPTAPNLLGSSPLVGWMPAGGGRLDADCRGGCNAPHQRHRGARSRAATGRAHGRAPGGRKACPQRRVHSCGVA